MSLSRILHQTPVGEVWLRWSCISDFSEEQLVIFDATLSKAEQIYINAALTEDLKTSRLIGRGVLREELSRCTGINAADLVIETTDSGKPVLSVRQNDGIEFSLSRSGDYILHGFTKGNFEIGVDVEKIDAQAITTELVSHAMNAIEQSYWRALQEQQQVEHFFRTWVYKEAVLKADGCGLSGLKDLMAQSHTFIYSQKRLWQLTDLDAPSGYRAALASPALLCKLKFY